MDFYIKDLVIHQFMPDDTELLLADQPLTVTPLLEEYFSRKLAKVFSDEAKRGQFTDENPFFKQFTADFLDSSIKIAQLWREAFVVSEDQRPNDLIFIRFDKDGAEHFAFLRLTLKESLTHLSGQSDAPIKLTQNTLPGAAQAPTEALVVNRATRYYYLIEKRIKHNGSFAHYFSENLLQVQPENSVKRSLKVVEQAAKKVADDFRQDDFAFQSKMKAAIHDHLEEQELAPEKLADQLFDDNLTARLTFVDNLKEEIPEPIKLTDIDYSKQSKKLSSQKLSLSNGIELIVPNQIYQDAETVEFIQNQDGTYSILIKNIQDIQNK